MQRTLGVASNVLADRLNRVVAPGILDRVAYQQRPVRHEYRATAGCGGRVRTVPRCEACETEVPVREVAVPLAMAT